MARDKLNAHHQRLYDALLIDALVLAGRCAEMIERLSQIAPEQRSAAVRRHLETAQTSALQRAAAARDLRQALGLWSGVIRARRARVRRDVHRTSRPNRAGQRPGDGLARPVTQRLSRRAGRQPARDPGRTEASRCGEALSGRIGAPTNSASRVAGWLAAEREATPRPPSNNTAEIGAQSAARWCCNAAQRSLRSPRIFQNKGLCIRPGTRSHSRAWNESGSVYSMWWASS